jgi:VWFA-related protein
MQPGDLVSILRTDYGNRAMNMFQSDKHEVRARINALPSTMHDRHTFDAVAAMGGPAARASQEMKRLSYINLHENQLSTLSYSIRALKNMPGRKFLIIFVPASHRVDADLFSMFSQKYKSLADEALRAGTVVNLIDFGVIETNQFYIDPVGAWESAASFSARALGGDIQRQNLLNLQFVGTNSRLENPNNMPEQTGGITVTENNFYLNGIGTVGENLMKGYYLVSYAPPADTFKARNNRDDLYRPVKIRVRRKDAVVYTRSGFFGRLESGLDADTANQNPLIEAIYSPYQSTDINVNIAAGYVKDDANGYLVRSWIHLDPQNVKIVETEDGSGKISLEAVYVTSDINGKIQDSKHVDFSMSKINMDWVKKHGIRFSMLLPIKKPGPYYVRISVQDKESGKIGSAYQFLEIPDLKKKELALSNIFMITSADDIQWMNSREASEGVFFPMFQEREIRSPALRTYAIGDNLMTLTMLYNADAKAIARSEIRTQAILYKDGKEFLRGEPTPIASASVEDPGNILLANRFPVTSDMTPGDYVLQIIASDKKSGERQEGSASRIISFTVVEK